MRLKEFLFVVIIFILSGCQNKQVVLFEDIYIGDNLETCLAKGTIRYNPDYNKEIILENDVSMIELANNYIASSYFTNSEVKFDWKNVVKEIELKFQQEKRGRTAKDVFSFMTQYFCQRYQGMKTEIIDEEKVYDRYEECTVKFRREGMANIWETNKIKIILKSYDNTLLDRYNVHKALNPDDSDLHLLKYLVWLDIDSNEGKWVELNIVAK